MNIEQIQSCIHAILTQDDAARNEAIQALSMHSQDINFSYFLTSIITNNQTEMVYRLLCLTFFIRSNVIFPPQIFPQFLPLYKIPDTRLSSQVTELLSKNITADDQIMLMLSTASGDDLTYLIGILSLLAKFLVKESRCADQILMFCTNLIAQTQEIPLESPNIDQFLKIRGLATESISAITCPDSDETPNPSFIPLLIQLFSLPINDIRNFHVVKNILYSSINVLPELNLYEILCNHLKTLSEISPLRGEYIEFASSVVQNLNYLYEDSFEIEFEPAEIIPCLIKCSILNDDILERWKTNINEFFSEYIYPNDDKCDSDDEDDDADTSDFFYFRSECLQFCGASIENVSLTLQVCLDIMRLSPYHAELSYFYISRTINPNYPADFDLFCPPDSKHILYGSYLYAVASLNQDIDGGTVEECLESNNDFLLLFVAKSICVSDNSIFLRYLVPTTMKLLNMLYMFDLPESSSFIEFISKLISKDPTQFYPLMENLIGILFQIFNHMIQNYSALLEILTIFNILVKSSVKNGKVDLAAFIIQSSLPIISKLFAECDGNSYFVLVGIDFLNFLFVPLQNSILPIESIKPFFDTFISIINDSLTTHFIDFNQNTMYSIMPLLIFYSRAIQPSPFAPAACGWFVKALMSFDLRESQFFKYWPSLVIQIFQNDQSHEDQIVLLKAIYMRFMNNNNLPNGKKSLFFDISGALAFSSLILLNMEYFVKYLEECEIDIKHLLPIIAQILENTHESGYFDYLIIIAALFRFGDLPVFEFEELRPMNLVAWRVLISTINRLFLVRRDDDEYLLINNIDEKAEEYKANKETYFMKDDPYFYNHPFNNMKFSEFLRSVLPPPQQIPPSFVDNYREIIGHL